MDLFLIENFGLEFIGNRFLITSLYLHEMKIQQYLCKLFFELAILINLYLSIRYMI
jgi:hypothetical protein